MRYVLLFVLLLPGCSGKPDLQEGKVRVTSTADLGKAAGVK